MICTLICRQTPVVTAGNDSKQLRGIVSFRANKFEDLIAIVDRHVRPPDRAYPSRFNRTPYFFDHFSKQIDNVGEMLPLHHIVSRRDGGNKQSAMSGLVM